MSSYVKHIVLFLLSVWIVSLNDTCAYSQPAMSLEEAEQIGLSLFTSLEKENVAHPMEYLVLKKCKAFNKQVAKPNTIYEIRHKYNLKAQTIELPRNCVLVFKGGRICNGVLVGEDVAYCSDKDVVKCLDCDTVGSFKQVSQIVKAGSIGMRSGTDDSAQHNFTVFKAAIEQGNNVFIDGQYYVKFSNPIKLDRELRLYGGELVYQSNAFSFADGGGLVLNGSVITASKNTPSAFFCGSTKHLGAISITEISFVNSIINCAYLAQAEFEDINSDETLFGIKRLLVNHCVFNKTGRIRVLDAVISDKCSFTNNYYKFFSTTPIYIACQHSAQVSKNDKSAYQFVAQNLLKGSPVVIDSNIFIGKPVSLDFYYCAALIKAVDCAFTNNYVKDIINFSDGVDHAKATAYDSYLSCARVRYERNFVKDVISYSTNGGTKPKSQIGKSKTNPVSYVGIKSSRQYKDNCFIVDGDRFLNDGADPSSLYSDIFGNNSYINDYSWENNAIIYRHAQVKTGVAAHSYESFSLVNNYFELDGVQGSGLVTVRSDERMKSIVVKDNTFRLSNKQLFPVFNQKFAQNYYKNGRIAITDNHFINSAAKVFFFTGDEVIIKRNEEDYCQVPGNLYLSKYSGSGTIVDVESMDAELKFSGQEEDKGGLMQYYSSSSKGCYSVLVNRVPPKGVNYYYTLGADDGFMIEMAIESSHSHTVCRIPIRIENGGVSYEYEGKTVVLSPGKRIEKVWYDGDTVQFRTVFYSSDSTQILFQLRRKQGINNSDKSIRFTFESL